MVKKYLSYYIKVAKKNNAIPVLLSSIYRRHFDKKGNIIDNCHLDYPEAMKQLAHKENVVYIDMCELSKQMLIDLGDEASKELFINSLCTRKATKPLELKWILWCVHVCVWCSVVQFRK